MSANIVDVKNKIYGASATNRNPIYNSHIYWSQKPFNICNILIEAFSSPGDTVFDPFLGSGVTLLQSISKEYNRKSIGCEINEAPLFIVKTLLKKYSLPKYIKVLANFLTQLRQLQNYYFTACPICGSKTAVVTSVIFDKESREADIKIKRINYRCGCSSKCYKEADEHDYRTIRIEYSLAHINNLKLIPNSKIAVYENQTISQIFTNRNFVVLDAIIGIVEQLGEYKDLFKYILMSVLHLCKITDKHSNSQWPLWIPKVDCVEKNIIDILEKKASKFSSAIKYLSENYSSTPSYTLLHKGSQFITETDIPNDSVQLVITDPPYLGQVAYSEYMQLYKPFLGLDFNLDDEIVVSSAPSRDKNEEDYFNLLNQVFGICSLKLKEGAYFCMYFHDCNLDVWDRLIRILSAHNLRYLSQAHIAKGNTLKNIISPKKSLNGDCILFFTKDSGPAYRQAGTETAEEVEKNIIKQSKQLVRQYQSLSTPELYDKGLMEVLIQNGWLTTLASKHKSLVEIFEKHLKWDAETSKWIL